MFAAPIASTCSVCARPSPRLTAGRCSRCLLVGSAVPLPRCLRCTGQVLTVPALDRFAGAEYERTCLQCGEDLDHPSQVEYPLAAAVDSSIAATLAALTAEAVA
jgi:hypothetical protein